MPDGDVAAARISCVRRRRHRGGACRKARADFAASCEEVMGDVAHGWRAGDGMGADEEVVGLKMT